MNVKELKKLLQDVSDEMEVFVLGESALGGFMFLPACIEDSGILEIAPPDECEGEEGVIEGGKIFAVMPHGATIDEDEIEDAEEDKTALN